jgi:hypothetical protein
MLVFVFHFDRLVDFNWLVNNDRLVDFLLDHFVFFDDGGFVVDMHWFHESVSMFLLFHFDWDVDDDFSVSATVDLIRFLTVSYFFAKVSYASVSVRITERITNNEIS